jgi:hypothetical protein
MVLGKYSLGTGDRFGQQGEAQLRAVVKARKEHNTIIHPVWNKSHREHEIIGTGPEDVRKEADQAVQELGWEESYFVDADHITKGIVDPYISCSNFFTIDVADYIGQPADENEKKQFVEKNLGYTKELNIPGIEDGLRVTKSFLEQWADTYLYAIRQAKEIFEYIREQKSDRAVFEVSMDEVETPQTPVELFLILKTLGELDVQIHTIAPKFTGDFYKGIDYEGNMDQFVTEFEQDILVIAHAVQEFGLPADLKLSIHSGSDKFSLYPHMHRLITKHEAGIHLKTSGTTWLEELIGLASSGMKGTTMVKDIYKEAYGRYDELTNPYKTVIDINPNDLPSPEEFDTLKGHEIEAKLEHNPQNPAFDTNLRQFLHCSYKVAAEKKDLFIELLSASSEKVNKRVTDNLFQNHIKPLFLGKE